MKLFISMMALFASAAFLNNINAYPFDFPVMSSLCNSILSISPNGAKSCLREWIKNPKNLFYVFKVFLLYIG
jgi:hypothetical protein